MYGTDRKDGLEFNDLLNRLIEKNLFTKKQISIIYNKVNLHTSNVSNDQLSNQLSAGAYYRQVKQCRKKYDRFIYTILLFRLLNLIDNTSIQTIESMVNQLEKISRHDIHHNSPEIVSNDIIVVIEEILRRINKV
ncbi:MAG TPA: hypothetical protein VHJ57_03070 [Nitrososphaeraceae archaeon]|nr:hypothetical protein [Nitrososphaeraceae archaeon]